jgi:hypothetical protein
MGAFCRRGRLALWTVFGVGAGEESCDGFHDFGKGDEVEEFELMQGKLERAWQRWQTPYLPSKMGYLLDLWRF